MIISAYVYHGAQGQIILKMVFLRPGFIIHIPTQQFCYCLNWWYVHSGNLKMHHLDFWSGLVSLGNLDTNSCLLEFMYILKAQNIVYTEAHLQKICSYMLICASNIVCPEKESGAFLKSPSI